MRTTVHAISFFLIVAGLLLLPMPGDEVRGARASLAGTVLGLVLPSLEEPPVPPVPPKTVDDATLGEPPEENGSGKNGPVAEEEGEESAEEAIPGPPADLRTFRAQDPSERRLALEKLRRLEKDPACEALRGPILYAEGYLLALDGKHAEAEAILGGAEVRASSVADHALYMRARIAMDSHDAKGASELFATLLRDYPDSLFQVKGRRDLVYALRQQGRIPEALRETDLLAAWSPHRIAPEEIFYLRGECWEAGKDAARASAEYERIYFDAPASPVAREVARKKAFRAWLASVENRADRFDARLRRAEILFSSRRYGEAAAEYEALQRRWASRLDGDRLALRLGTCYVEKGRAEKALQTLSRVSSREPALRGEALYLSALAWRRLGKEKKFEETIEALAGQPEGGPYTVKALARLAEDRVDRDDLEGAIASWRRVLDLDPDGPDARRAHNRIGWSLYRKGLPAEARPHWEEFARRAEDDHDRAMGLYWAAKCLLVAGEEREADLALRRVYMEFPNDYYGDRARRLLRLPLQRVPGADQAVEPDLLAGRLAEVLRRFPPSHPARRNLRKVGELVSVGLYGEAFEELDWIAETLGEHTDARALRMDLASHAGRNRMALLLFRELHPDHRARTDIPVGDWRTAYPRRYLREIREATGGAGLSLDLVLGLIHQESVFEPQARSWVGARGLMQIMPGTGRTIARDLRVSPFRTDMLDDAGTNLRFGTSYLRKLLDEFGGSKEMALAAYNAGPGRARRWAVRAAGDPDLFVEGITFSETRNYVKRVLFNEALYARLYPPANAGDVTPGRAVAGR